MITNEEIDNLRRMVSLLPEGYQGDYSNRHFNYFCELKVLYKHINIDDVYAFENSYEYLKEYLNRGYIIIEKYIPSLQIFPAWVLTLAKE